nr:hypothetical protein [Tanacetum cinerariifolium]
MVCVFKHIPLTNADIRNSDTYKEYYAVATRATPPKTKASVRKMKSSFETTVTPPPTTAIGRRLFTFAKGKQPATTSKAKSLTALSEVAMIEAEQLKLAIKRSIQQTHISQASESSDEGEDDDDDDEGNDDDDAQDDDDDQEDANKDDDDQKEGDDDDDDQEECIDDEQAFGEEGKEFIHPSLSTHDEKETRDKESFDPILKTPKNMNDEGNGEENLGLNVGREEGQDKEDDEDKLYRDVNINLEGRGVQMANVHTTQEFEDSHVTLTLVNSDGQQHSASVTMDITIDQQVALDDALVPLASRLRIGKSNFRLRSDLKSKESTLQVVYDVLKLTPFYKAFLVTADVLEICIREFWATTTVHHHLIRFKMKNKKHIVNLDYFREMLQICPRIPNQQFDELPFKEAILTFLRELGHSGEIKMITDQYGAILLIELTNEAIGNSESYKEYYAITSGAEPPKTKASARKKQSSSDTTMPPPNAKGKRLKTSTKVDKPVKEKQPAKMYKAKCLTVLFEVALTEAEQMKLAIKQSLTQTRISHASGSGADEGTGIIPEVPDVPTYESDNEKISWKSSEDNDDDDEVNTNNDGDDFIHPKFTTHYDEDKEEESFDPIVQTPSHDEKTDDEDNDEDSHGMNVKGDEMDDE